MRVGKIKNSHFKKSRPYSVSAVDTASHQWGSEACTVHGRHSNSGFISNDCSAGSIHGRGI